MEFENPAPLVMTPSELRRLNWALAAFARSSAALMRFTTFEGLAPQICQAIVGDDDYLLAAVGLAETGPTKPVRLFGAAGRAAAYVDGISFSWSDQVPEGLGPAGRAIRSLEPLIMRDSTTDDRFSHWVDRASEYGIRSSVTVPFVGDDGTVGILIVYADRPDAFGEQELEVFAKLAHELGFAMTVDKARSNLRNSEARYRLLAENTQDVLIVYDPQGRITYVTPSIRRYGHDPADLVGRQIGGLVHPDNQARIRQRFIDSLAGEPVPVDVHQAQSGDGNWVWFEGQMGPLRDDAGVLIGVLAVQRDISARKAAEQALSEVNAELTRVARISSLGAFSASLAHEINQPLAAMATNCDVALRWLSRDPPDLARMEQAIIRSVEAANRASEIIGRMRAMMTKGPSKIIEFDVNAAIGEVLALTQAERGSNSQLTVALTPRSPLIKGDRIQFQQVMMNLVQNALDAMQSTPANDWRLIIRSDVVEGGDVLVEVEDRGPGLDSSKAEQIFEQLFTTKEGGTGLGLSISRSIIESHGGRIWVTPAAPRGARFCVQLPSAAYSPSDVRAAP
jgi:PAS domain S-box-containing protein